MDPRILNWASATGDAYPALRSSKGPRENRWEVNDAFDANDRWAQKDPPAQTGGPYGGKESLGSWIHVVKWAAHAEDRLRERTKIPEENLQLLRNAVMAMGLSPGHYYLPMRDQAGVVLAYAQWKPVTDQQHPVLATVLAGHMMPKGQNLEGIMKKGSLTTELQMTRWTTPPYDGKIFVLNAGARPADVISRTFDGLKQQDFPSIDKVGKLVLPWR